MLDLAPALSLWVGTALAGPSWPVPQTRTYTLHTWEDGRYDRVSCSETIGPERDGAWPVETVCDGDGEPPTALVREKGAVWLEVRTLPSAAPERYRVLPRRAAPGDTWTRGDAVCTATSTPVCARGIAASCTSEGPGARERTVEHHCPTGPVAFEHFVENAMELRRVAWVSDTRVDGEPVEVATDARDLPIRARWSADHCPARPVTTLDDLVVVARAQSPRRGPRLVPSGAPTFDQQPIADPSELAARVERASATSERAAAAMGRTFEARPVTLVVAAGTAASTWRPWVDALMALRSPWWVEVSTSTPVPAPTGSEQDGLDAEPARTARIEVQVRRLDEDALRAGCGAAGLWSHQGPPPCGALGAFVERVRVGCPDHAPAIEPLAAALAAELGAIGALEVRPSDEGAWIEVQPDTPFAVFIGEVVRNDGVIAGVRQAP